MAQPQLFTLGYRRSLDGLRAFAVLTVMMYHSLGAIVRGGFLGVDVFFVLSGFLITTLLLEERAALGKTRFKNFYWRRALRLLPALFVTLAIAAAYGVVTSPGKVSSATLFGVPVALVYMSNWSIAFDISNLGVLTHTWSLSIEEQFYIVWPVTLVLLMRWAKTLRLVFWLVVAGAAASAAWRAYLWFEGATIDRLFYGTDTRADTLLVGCALAILLMLGFKTESQRRRRIIAAGGWVGILTVGIAILLGRQVSRFWYLGGFTVFAIATAFIILYLLVGPAHWIEGLLASRIIVWIGRRSYGLYLYHLPIFAIQPVWHGFGHPLSVITEFAATFIVAGLSFRYVEQPFLRLKRRYATIESEALADKEVSAISARP